MSDERKFPVSAMLMKHEHGIEAKDLANGELAADIIVFGRMLSASDDSIAQAVAIEGTLNGEKASPAHLFVFWLNLGKQLSRMEGLDPARRALAGTAADETTARMLDLIRESRKPKLIT